MISPPRKRRTYRRVREGKRPENPGAKRAYVTVEVCWRCGALVDKLTPLMVRVIFGTQHLERDEVPVGDVACWSRWCRGCFDTLAASGFSLVVRGDLEFKLSKVVLEGKMDVRRDRIINAWAVRSSRAEG